MLERVKEKITLLNKTKGRKGNGIKYIVIHYTGNDTDTALGNANYFHLIPRGASAHYFVDEREVYRVVADCDTSWAVGKKYGNAPFWGRCTNYNSISIEMCSTHGRIGNDTFKNTVELTKELMQKYNVSADRVIRHYDVCHKQCPAWQGWIGSDEHIWTEFKALIGQPNNVTVSHVETVIKANNDDKRDIIRIGQGHSNNFLEHKIVADGIIGSETKKQMVRVLQHGLNLDYNARLVEDGILGKATISALGNHYVKHGEKQYMVTVAEILCNMHGIKADVECAGIYGSGLAKVTSKELLDKNWFLSMVR